MGKVKIKRIERDENKLQEMYDLGIEDSNKEIKRLKQWLKKIWQMAKIKILV